MGKRLVNLVIVLLEFLQFIINQEECRKKWAAAENECARLQGQVQLSQAEIERQEKKILETRRQLELKLDTLSRFERDKNSMDIRFRSAITLINSYMSDMRIGSETKERLAGVKALLEGGELKKAQQVAFTRSPGGALDTISEAETTGKLAVWEIGFCNPSIYISNLLLFYRS